MRRNAFMVVLVCLSVLLAGCAGWGTDGSAAETTADDGADLEGVDDPTDGQSSGSNGTESEAGNVDGDVDADGGAEVPEDTGTDDTRNDGNDARNTTDDEPDAGAADGASVESANESVDDGDGIDEDASGSGDDADDNAVNGDADDSDDVGSDGGDATHTLALTVQGEDGEPVEGTGVAAIDDGGRVADDGTTDAGGLVELELQDGTYGLAFDAEGYEYPDGSEVVVDGADAERTIELRSVDDGSSAHALSVNLIDAGTGEALDGEVTARAADGGARTVTTEDGTATFEVAAGEYHLGADVEGYHEFHADEHSIEVTDETSYDLELHPEPPTHTLETTVVDAETGAPVEGARIEGIGGVHPAGFDMTFDGTTDEEGQTTVELYESPVPYDTTVSAEGYEGTSMRIDPTNDAEITIELDPETTSSGDRAGATATA